MTEGGLRVGQLVRSKAGRDAGTYFLVVGIAGPREVMVSDGLLRPVARPKKKNIKHLEVFPLRVKEATELFRPERVVTDRFVAEAIRGLLAESGISAALPTAAKRGDKAASGPSGRRGTAGGGR